MSANMAKDDESFTGYCNYCGKPRIKVATGMYCSVTGKPTFHHLCKDACKHGDHTFGRLTWLGQKVCSKCGEKY